jgi:hypothetical protein
VNDINELGKDNNDVIVTDEVCQSFEVVSGAILNCKRKMVVLGLGSWAGCRDLPLQWLQVVDQAQVFGVMIMPSFAASVATSWDLVAAGVERVLMEWAARHPPCCARGLPLWSPLPSSRPDI